MSILARHGIFQPVRSHVDSSRSATDDRWKVKQGQKQVNSLPPWGQAVYGNFIGVRVYVCF